MQGSRSALWLHPVGRLWVPLHLSAPVRKQCMVRAVQGYDHWCTLQSRMHGKCMLHACHMHCSNTEPVSACAATYAHLTLAGRLKARPQCAHSWVVLAGACALIKLQQMHGTVPCNTSGWTLTTRSSVNGCSRSCNNLSHADVHVLDMILQVLAGNALPSCVQG